MIRGKRWTAIWMTLFMMITMVPNMMVFGADTEKSSRKVYLHAQENPEADAPVVSELSLGDEFRLYLAVDDPNKGDYDSGTGEHKEPQYDMNGYTVKFYYDPAYFTFAGEDTQKPIDYQIPQKANSSEEGENPGNVDVEVGYYVHAHGAGTENIDGILYQTAYITVLFSGSWLPEKETPWYDLCALPLRPVKTGTSEVFISVYQNNDPYTLELLAKDVEGYSPVFDVDALNGGRHQINIKAKQRPAVPKADPSSGSYSNPVQVELQAEDGCEIYYTTAQDPQTEDYQLYTQPIPIDKSTVLYCYAKRLSDNQQSMTAIYQYQMIPSIPVLYFDAEGMKSVPNIYETNDGFRVYVDDGTTPMGIADDSDVYYTYSLSLPEEAVAEGDDPSTQWCKVSKVLGYIDIATTETVRLITKKGEDLSPAAIYQLGIQPAPAEANPVPQLPQEPVDVTLKSKTQNAEIYYTMDGSDPRVAGIRYTKPITVQQTCTLRTVAKYDGIYSEVHSYHYLFTETDNYSIEAFHPAGAYEESVTVSLTAKDSSKKIYYTMDGSEPNVQLGNLYQDGEIFQITSDTVIKAVCVDEDGRSGQIYTFEYKIKPAAPVFAPESMQFTNSGTVSVFMPIIKEGYSLYYTLDGSVPTTESLKAEGGSVDITVTQYTKISAVVIKDDAVYSDVVTQVYDVVRSRPAKPVLTPVPGIYTVKNDDPITVTFMPTANSVKIYYTMAAVGDANYPPVDPTPGSEETQLYQPGDVIEVKGDVLIKAVAENSLGIRSDLGLFHYMAVPEAPTAPDSCIIDSAAFMIPIQSIDGALVTYSLGGAENQVQLLGINQFYVDAQTGNAYADREKTKLLCENTQSMTTDPITLSLFCELNGVQSSTNAYTYVVQENAVAPPYTDQPSGTYPQEAVDAENHLLKIKAGCLDAGAEIEYSIGGEWLSYQGDILLSDDSVLRLRSRKNGAISETVSYVYTFVPMMPVISQASGTYSDTVRLTLAMPDSAPSDRTYYIYYRRNGDAQDVRYTGGEIEIDHSMSLKAFAVEDTTGKLSPNAIASYIIDKSDTQSGTVYVASPYDLVRRMDISVLDEQPYAEGIRLLSDRPSNDIYYTYTYTSRQGIVYTTDALLYNSMPILPTGNMKDLSITAWLTDENGMEIPQSRQTFFYEFLDLGVPKTSLEIQDIYAVNTGTDYTIENDWPEDENTFIYYTLDGSDPSDKNTARQLYQGETLSINKDTNVKTVYYNVCGTCDMCKAGNPSECRQAVYGRINSKTFSIKINRVSGGGGGGGVGLPTRPTEQTETLPKYTKDIFGKEHPTHISYITGYPDGSVRADGRISREEIAAILYRIKDKSYDAPFETTGTVFPDVNNLRWSVTEIEYLAQQKVILGYPDGTYQPEGELTRAEFAALIRRFANLDQPEGENPFPDVASEFWATQDITALYEAGLIDGYEDGSFRPEIPISRAEVMSIVNRILGRNPDDEYVKTLEVNPYSDLTSDKWYYTIVLEATITHDYTLNDAGVEYVWKNWK
ncbi:chitobiase/beta-hexosaminidase C-terminal domain-containing protein [Ructibacterium gallinarum]|uniref:Chitobiase/beta-hexosaminidase C-terminal domain-containing protein n=1 Tax=Ructibacterium gallinarum TaxID=2779355 RepID=A0A9D5M4R7_9FIRM|nr:chitobiase/beta-hexosaminidase C-terminal domain-containing protein [Ructibacterium gallinarum]MBE5039529.1 chitobiase/beta-hexosaminidase C-terminal domain-containing protein [Ructibacterium gallinarum]